MKVVILMLAILLMAAGCSSSPVQSELNNQAAYDSSMDAQGHYAQVIEMVKKSPDFSDNQKRDLEQLISQYAIKGHEVRAKETQYRAILVDEMLDGGKLQSMNKRVARENLNKLYIENNNNLDKFIKDFQAIAGDSSKNSTALVLKAVDTY